MNARKAHNTGRNHVANVRDYFASLGHDKAQSIIDQIVSQHESGGRAVMMAAPSMRLGAGFMNPVMPPTSESTRSGSAGCAEVDRRVGWMLSILTSLPLRLLGAEDTSTHCVGLYSRPQLSRNALSKSLAFWRLSFHLPLHRLFVRPCAA